MRLRFMRLKLKLKDKELFLDEEAWIKEQNWREERTRIVHNQMVDFLKSLARYCYYSGSTTTVKFEIYNIIKQLYPVGIGQCATGIIFNIF